MKQRMKANDSHRLKFIQWQDLVIFSRFTNGCQMWIGPESKSAIIGRISDKNASGCVLRAHPLGRCPDKQATYAIALKPWCDGNRSQCEPTRRTIKRERRCQCDLTNHNPVLFRDKG